MAAKSRSCKVLPAFARRALAICHYDPDTGEDRAADRCGRACCECLLDYGNQPDHRILDRALIRDLSQTFTSRVPPRRRRGLPCGIPGRASEALRQPARRALARHGGVAGASAAERCAVRHPRPLNPIRLLLPGGERRHLRRRSAARHPGPGPRGRGEDPRPDRDRLHRDPLPPRGGLAGRVPPPPGCVRRGAVKVSLDFSGSKAQIAHMFRADIEAPIRSEDSLAEFLGRFTLRRPGSVAKRPERGPGCAHPLLVSYLGLKAWRQVATPKIFIE